MPTEPNSADEKMDESVSALGPGDSFYVQGVWLAFFLLIFVFLCLLGRFSSKDQQPNGTVLCTEASLVRKRSSHFMHCSSGHCRSFVLGYPRLFSPIDQILSIGSAYFCSSPQSVPSQWQVGQWRRAGLVNHEFPSNFRRNSPRKNGDVNQKSDVNFKCMVGLHGTICSQLYGHRSEGV